MVQLAVCVRQPLCINRWQVLIDEEQRARRKKCHCSTPGI